jgi:Fe-S-cluster-containing hydrogenase component 2
MIGSPSFAPIEQASAAPECGACPTDCVDACFNAAIVAGAGEGVWIRADNCAGCGACIPACEFGFIRLQDGVACIVFPKGKPEIPDCGLPGTPQWSE